MNCCRPRRLKVVNPVCECKNERKIVERNEEKSRWNMRQKRLKALKKQAFMHVVDISRPMIQDTNLIISEVTRIPGKTKHEEDVKYCISGVSKDISMSPPQQILDGVKMCTPLQTPEPSKEDIPSVAVHRHWSPMNVPPGPLPRKDAALKEEMNRRKKARDEALMLIYGDVSKQDTSHSTYRIYQEMCDEEKLMQNVERSQEPYESYTNIEEKTSETITELPSPIKKTNSTIKRQQDDASRKINHENKKHIKGATGKIDHRSESALYNQITEGTEEKIDDQIKDSIDEKHTSQPNLMEMTKVPSVFSLREFN